MVCSGERDRQAGTHSCTRTPALLQSVVQASLLSHTHIRTHLHTAGAELNAVPAGLQWRGRGTERCFWLPAEPLSSGQQAPAPPGPHTWGVGGFGGGVGGGVCGPRMREQRENTET